MAVAVVKLLLPSKRLYSDSAKSSSQCLRDNYLWRTPISFVSTRPWRGSLELFATVFVEKRNLLDSSTVKTRKLITESETGSPDLQIKKNSQAVGSDSVCDFEAYYAIGKLSPEAGSSRA